jgi:hypothetical protein
MTTICCMHPSLAGRGMAPPEREESIRCLRLLRDLCGGAACYGLIRDALAAPTYLTVFELEYQTMVVSRR